MRHEDQRVRIVRELADFLHPAVRRVDGHERGRGRRAHVRVHRVEAAVGREREIGDGCGKRRAGKARAGRCLAGLDVHAIERAYRARRRHVGDVVVADHEAAAPGLARDARGGKQGGRAGRGIDLGEAVLLGQPRVQACVVGVCKVRDDVADRSYDRGLSAARIERHQRVGRRRRARSRRSVDHVGLRMDGQRDDGEGRLVADAHRRQQDELARAGIDAVQVAPDAGGRARREMRAVARGVKHGLRGRRDGQQRDP